MKKTDPKKTTGKPSSNNPSNKKKDVQSEIIEPE